MVAQALEVEPEIIVAPAKRTGEVSHYVADLSKATTLLGYRPQTPLEQGIVKAVAWWRTWQAETMGREVKG